MFVLEYSLKFTNWSDYSSSLVSNPTDEMNRIVLGVFDDVVEHCRLGYFMTTWTFLIFFTCSTYLEE